MRRCCECRMALRIRSTFRQSGSDLSLVSSRGDARRSRSSLSKTETSAQRRHRLMSPGFGGASSVVAHRLQRWPQNGHCCSKIVCSFMACSPGEWAHSGAETSDPCGSARSNRAAYCRGDADETNSRSQGVCTARGHPRRVARARLASRVRAPRANAIFRAPSSFRGRVSASGARAYPPRFLLARNSRPAQQEEWLAHCRRLDAWRSASLQLLRTLSQPFSPFLACLPPFRPRKVDLCVIYITTTALLSFRWLNRRIVAPKPVILAAARGAIELRTAAETRTKQIRAARVFALREAIREELRELVWRQGSARRARTPSFERLLRFEVASQLLELALIRHGFDWRGTRDRHNRRSGWRTVGV